MWNDFIPYMTLTRSLILSPKQVEMKQRYNVLKRYFWRRLIWQKRNHRARPLEMDAGWIARKHGWTYKQTRRTIGDLVKDKVIQRFTYVKRGCKEGIFHSCNAYKWVFDKKEESDKIK